MGSKNKSKTLWTLFKQGKVRRISQPLVPGWVRALRNKIRIVLQQLVGNSSRATTIHQAAWSTAIRWVPRRLSPIIQMAALTMKRLLRRALKQMGNYPRRVISCTRSWGSNLINPMRLTINWGPLMQISQISQIRPMGHNNNLKMPWGRWARLAQSTQPVTKSPSTRGGSLVGRTPLNNNSSNKTCNYLYSQAAPVSRSERSKWSCGVSRPQIQANKVLSWWDRLCCRMSPTPSWTTLARLTRAPSLTNRISWTRASRRARWTQPPTGITKVPEWRNLKSRVTIIIIAGATVELIKNKIICKVNNKIQGFNNSINIKT